jgi:hypothetical protein
MISLVSPIYNFRDFCQCMFRKDPLQVIDAASAEITYARLIHREKTKGRDFRRGSIGRAYCDDLQQLISLFMGSASDKVSPQFVDAVIPLALHLLQKWEIVGLRQIVARPKEPTVVEVADFPIRFGSGTTIKSHVSARDYVLWARWNDVPESGGKVKLLDFWELKDGDAVTITNCIADLPPWFELHPSEMSHQVSTLQEQDEDAPLPAEPSEGPNLWRARTGDRMVWLCGRATPASRSVQALLEFSVNAFVFGEPRQPWQDVIEFMPFGAPSAPSPTDEVTALVRAGLAAVMGLGRARKTEEADEWTFC